MQKKIIMILFVSCFLVSAYASAVVAVTIDLNDFYADPAVTVAPDGASAIMVEDSVCTVLLANDPGLGEPNVIIPQSGFELLFDYVFTEGADAGEDDEFGVFILDGATGFCVGSPYEFFTGTTASGSIGFDLTGLVGMTLGLQFQLGAFPGDTGFDSVVEISNLRIEQSPGIPEPSIIFLFGLGLLVTAGISREKLFF
ncbi:MAG: PEP-CTERM sorting domain-containing protein [Desulfobacteraceae bacterium]|nr:PEP-CTERM sorting domain-containing protein [Desulfobacteraceae bacterium]